MSELAPIETTPATQKPLKRGDLRNALICYARAETDAGRIDHMSLRAAARDLGVSSGAVYRHFDDKDALLKAVAHQGFEEIRERFVSIRPESEPATAAEIVVARAFKMGRAFVEFAHEHTALWRMMFGRIGVLCRKDKESDPTQMGYTVQDCTFENMRDLYRLGGIEDEPTLEDTRFFWSAIHGAADLSQCKMRVDNCCMEEVADQTTARSMRALGCDRALIARGRALLDTGS